MVPFHRLSASDHFDGYTDIQTAPSLVRGQGGHAELGRQGKTGPISKRQSKGPGCRAKTPSVRTVVTRSRSEMIGLVGGIGRRLGLLTGTKGSSSDEDVAAEQHASGAALPG